MEKEKVFLKKLKNCFSFFESINDWAVNFGDELWELAETMTKAKEIKQVC